MQLEQSLAAGVIARLAAQGFGPTACITAAARFLVSQGFGKTHSQTVARQMAELVL